jgi:hypothetical protein
MSQFLLKQLFGLQLDECVIQGSITRRIDEMHDALIKGNKSLKLLTFSAADLKTK